MPMVKSVWLARVPLGSSIMASLRSANEMDDIELGTLRLNVVTKRGDRMPLRTEKPIEFRLKKMNG